jgi:hypothetical protein
MIPAALAVAAALVAALVVLLTPKPAHAQVYPSGPTALSGVSPTARLPGGGGSPENLVPSNAAEAAADPASGIAACEPRGSMKGASLSVEVDDEFGPYRSDQVVQVSDLTGKPLLSLACNGPNDLFRLAPGAYRVQAFVGETRSPEVAVNVPSAGARVRLTMQRAPNQPVNKGID